MNLKCSLITNSKLEDDKINFVNEIIKYNNPNKLKLLLISENKLTFNNYEGLPHLLWPTIYDFKKALAGITKIVNLMDDRYDKFDYLDYKCPKRGKVLEIIVDKKARRRRI